MASGEYVAIIAAHQTELGAGIGRRRRRLHRWWILREGLGEARKKREVGSGERRLKGDFIDHNPKKYIITSSCLGLEKSEEIQGIN